VKAPSERVTMGFISVGAQGSAADANGDGRPDVIVASKKGIFLHLRTAGKR
jgi:FG-GAP repeat